MGLPEINKFFYEIKSHQKNPADIIRYKRWIKELKDPLRKNLLEILKNQGLHQLTEDQISDLYNNIQQIGPIVKSDQSYKSLSLRDKGIYKSLCRMFSNLFQNRTSSKKVLNAILNQRNFSSSASKISQHAETSIPSTQIALLDKNLFKFLAHLPTKEIEEFKDLTQIPNLVGQGPVTLLYEKNGGLFLGLKLMATHIPSPDNSQLNPFSFEMLIRLDGIMKIWTTSKLAERFTSGFNSASFNNRNNLTHQLVQTFMQQEQHDNLEMIQKKCHYDTRWLIARLSDGKSALIRHVPDDVVWAEVSDPAFKNYGYWDLSLKYN